MLLAIERAVATIRSSDPGEMPCHSCGHLARAHLWRRIASGRGRPPKLMWRDGKHRPLSVKELALRLPKRAWRTIKWRDRRGRAAVLAFCD